MKKYPFIAILGWTAWLWSCDTQPPPEPEITSSLQNEGVFILNEGNFQRGNASLDFYDLEADSLLSGVFEATNGQRPGDVLQSMVLRGDRAYLVVNNSQKIEVVQAETMASLGRIEGLTSPRYLWPISGAKAYVTDLYAGKVSVLNLNNLEVSQAIDLPGWTEQLREVEGEIWVANYDRPYLYVIDPALDQLVDSVAVPMRGGQLQVDASGHLWLGTGASITDGSPGHLLRIDPQARRVEQDWTFAPERGPGELTLSGDRDSLFWLDEGVYAMSIDAERVPSTPLIGPGGILYGLGVHPRSGEIFVADAVDYVQRGVILRYAADGEPLDTFRAGIIPGDFVFRLQ